jgi:hypothetical protein
LRQKTKLVFWWTWGLVWSWHNWLLLSIVFILQTDGAGYIGSYAPLTVRWVRGLMPFCNSKLFFAADTGDVTGGVDIWKVGKIEHKTPLL